MPKKIQDCSMAHLISVPLPAHGASYTTISHQFVIDYSKQQLIAAGFDIVDEEYRCTADGQIAQGIYKLNYNSDSELSMMFAWTNSYNKQVKFKCLIGAYINRTGAVMTSGELGTWSRKHTGTADTETKDMIDTQVQNANMYYDQLVSDKATMESVSLNKRRQAQMLGILFAEFQILTTEQASIIRQQMDRPSHVYTDSNSLWAFYNYVTIALQHSHPRTWLEDQRILHYFISTVGNFQQCSTPAQIIQPVAIVTEVVEPEVDPNQINLLDQIADLEAQDVEIHVESDQEYLERVAEIEGEPEELASELHLAETTFMNARELELQNELEEDTFAMAQLSGVKAPEIIDLDDEEDEDWNQLEVAGIVTPIVEYTDPVGNTFEAPIVIDDLITEENLEEEIHETDFSLPDDDEELSQRAADEEMIEAIESSVGDPIVANLDNIPVEKKEEIIDNSFDLDFGSNDTEESADDIPDFF